MRAVVMAGGRGERLRPLTDSCPKPLLPVAGRPVLDRLLEKLAEAGIQDVTLAVGYLGSMIEDYVGDGARWGVRADYVRQEKPMGTAGALSLMCAAKYLVVNGDKIIERAADICRLIYIGSGNYRAVAATTKYRIPYGVIDDHEFREKPSVDACAGLYVVGSELVERAQPIMDMPDLFADRWVMPIAFEGYVLDIGTPATYEAACARLS